jgi:hypothetical protein
MPEESGTEEKQSGEPCKHWTMFFEFAQILFLQAENSNLVAR